MKLSAIFSNSAGVLLSRIFGFIRDLTMAWVLGANIYSDIFAVAFKLPNLFRRIFGEGAFAQSFMPSFIRAKYKTIFSAKILTYLIISIVLLSIAINLLAPIVTKILAPGFDESTIILTAKYVAIQFWYLPLIFMVTLFGALLQYKEHFATTAFSTVLLNISLIIAMLLYKDESKETILLALSYAVVVGGALQVLVHIVVAQRLKILRVLKFGFHNFNRKQKEVREDVSRFFKNFFPAIWGNSTTQVMSFLDTWLASFLVAGSISYLYYANRVYQLPLAIFAIALSVAIFPTISKRVKAGDSESAIRELGRGFWILLYLLSGSAIGAIIFAEEIIWLLFERGAFTRENTIEVAWVLRMYMVGLIPYGVGRLFNIWLYANHQQLKAAKIATASLILYAISASILILPLEAKGLALSSSLSSFLGFYLIIKSFGVEKFKEIALQKELYRFTVSTIIFTALLYFIKITWLHI